MIGIEEDGEKRIRSRIDACIQDFDREIVDGRPELLTIPMTDMLGKWKPEPDMDLVEEVYRMLFRGWLLGMAHSSRHGRDDYADISMDFGLTFEEAIEFAKGRLSLTPQQFSRLSDDLKLHAFTIGRLAQLDMIGKVKDAYVRQLGSSGMSLEDFLRDVGRIDADQAGFAGYYSTVFRTNLQKDYNAGKAYQMMQDPPMYLQFVGIDDERQSGICEARTGIILPYTDPWWDDNWPPLHFNCRSTVREVSAEEVAQLRREFEDAEERAAKAARSEGRRYTKKKWKLEPPNKENHDREVMQADGTKKTIRRNIPVSSFGRRPAIDNAFWGTTPGQQNRVAMYMIQDEINSVAGQTVCRDFAETKSGFTSVEVDRGGVRYQNGLDRDSEFTNNLADSTALANATGYYVELRKAEGRLEGNPQWDAWLNGVEKAEFKHSGSSNDGTLEDLVRKGVKQAGTVILTLEKESQIDPLFEAIRKNMKNIMLNRDVRQLIIGLGGRYAFLTNADLKSAISASFEEVRSKLDVLKKG